MNPSALVTLLVGFALGLKHSTEADHLAAVSALVSDTTGARRAARVGTCWGLGHLLAIFAAGSLLIALHLRMTARLQWTLDLLVAFVLIALGARTIARCWSGRYHFHAHEHGGHVHAHLHFHQHSAPGHEHNSPPHLHLPSKLGQGAQSVLVGMAHGLAGTAGLALLILGAIPSRALGLAYLLVFGLGALAGMAAFSALLGLPFARATRQLRWLTGMRLAAGAASGILGLILTYQAFFAGPLPF
jgi:hypothetical protein